MTTRRSALSLAQPMHRFGEELSDEAIGKARAMVSGVKGRFSRCKFESFDATTPAQTKVRTACEEFAAAFEPGRWGAPWLIGPPGTGKSHLGAAVVRHAVLERKLWATLISAREIVTRLRATWGGKGGIPEEEVINDLAGFDLLVVDEIGIGSGSDSELTQLFAVIDARYTLEHPTMLISNLNAPLIKANIGDRLFDRLQEGAEVFACNWPSHRVGART